MNFSSQNACPFLSIERFTSAQTRALVQLLSTKSPIPSRMIFLRPDKFVLDCLYDPKSFFPRRQRPPVFFLHRWPALANCTPFLCLNLFFELVGILPFPTPILHFPCPALFCSSVFLVADGFSPLCFAAKFPRVFFIGTPNPLTKRYNLLACPPLKPFPYALPFSPSNAQHDLGSCGLLRGYDRHPRKKRSKI